MEVPTTQKTSLSDFMAPERGADGTVRTRCTICIALKEGERDNAPFAAMLASDASPSPRRCASASIATQSSDAACATPAFHLAGPPSATPDKTDRELGTWHTPSIIFRSMNTHCIAHHNQDFTPSPRSDGTIVV